MSSRANLAGAVFYGLLAFSAAALVEAQAAPGQPVFAGPAIPGVCVLDQQAIFNRSKVGVFANTRYKEMRDGAQKAVSADQAKITSDAKALTGLKLPQAQMQQRQQNLDKRLDDLRARAAKESQDLEAARQGMVTKITAAVQPFIVQAYNNRKCGLLLAKGLVLAGNPVMDITNAVIGGLDVKVTAIPFDQKLTASGNR